jgi:hypothetical protein
MNQQDTDMLQIALTSSEHFNEDVPTPAIPDPFRDQNLLESLLDDPPENSSPNVNNWQSGPDRAVVFSNEFYISALQLAQAEITDLYPFWQLRQADLKYELTIIGVGYVKNGATDPLHSYHEMEFPITPKTIQQAPRPAQIQDFSGYPPKVELAVYLDFTVENPIQIKTYQLHLGPKHKLNPILILPKPGNDIVEKT